MLDLRTVAVCLIRRLNKTRKDLSCHSQTTCAGPFPSFDHYAPTGMHACYMPRDEGGRMDVSMRRSRQRRGNGGESRDFSWPEKDYISDRHRSNAAPSTTFCTLSTARRRSSTHHERSHHGTPRDPPTPSFSAPLTLPRRINIPPLSHRHFGSLARRLGRIFAHAYFHHREVFEQAEAESSLYARFLALTCKFDLVPPEFLIIPTRSGLSDDPEPPRLLAAAVDSLHQSGPDDENDDRGRHTHRGLGMDAVRGIDPNPSPRKDRRPTG